MRLPYTYIRHDIFHRYRHCVRIVSGASPASACLVFPYLKNTGIRDMGSVRNDDHAALLPIILHPP